MYDTIVVGSGIFGSVIARHLRRVGQDVCVIDDRRPDSGSAPAGCIIKPSWVSSMRKEAFQDGLDLLDSICGVREIMFMVRPACVRTPCFRVEPSTLLVTPDVTLKISAYDEGPSDAVLVAGKDENGNMHMYSGRRVVVAAGLWTPVLCPWVETWGRWGWSFRGPMVMENTISLWAPYRQVVAFNMDDGRSWSGDGSALIEKSAEKPGAILAAAARCARVVGDTLHTSTRGVRPYAETDGKPCLVSRRGSVWAVTGGAKNGTIAAAWAARELEREMGL